MYDRLSRQVMNLRPAGTVLFTFILRAAESLVRQQQASPVDSLRILLEDNLYTLGGPVVGISRSSSAAAKSMAHSLSSVTSIRERTGGDAHVGLARPLG